MSVLPLDTLMSLARFQVYEAMTIEGLDAVDATYVAERIDSNVTPSYVKLAFRQLKAANEIDYETSKNGVLGDVQTGRVYITARGIRVVEGELSNEDSITVAYQTSGLDGTSLPFVSSGLAPASDRLVAFSDNERGAKDARKAIETLRQKVIQTNDLPDELLPFRENVISEIDALQALISQTVVRASIVLTFARRLLPWLVEKAGGAAIGDLAKRALAALISWLT